MVQNKISGVTIKTRPLTDFGCPNFNIIVQNAPVQKVDQPVEKSESEIREERTVEKEKHAGLKVLNEMLYEHMHAAPDPEFHTGTHFIKRMLWDCSVVKTGDCSVLPDFFKCLGVPQDCIAFVGHTAATCKNKPKVFCKQEEKSGHVRLCKEKLHAMDTRWSLAFLSTGYLDDLSEYLKQEKGSPYKQRIAYAVVTNVFSSPQVQSCVCDLQWSPQKHMALI